MRSIYFDVAFHNITFAIICSMVAFVLVELAIDIGNKGVLAYEGQIRFWVGQPASVNSVNTPHTLYTLDISRGLMEALVTSPREISFWEFLGENNSSIETQSSIELPIDAQFPVWSEDHSQVAFILNSDQTTLTYGYKQHVELMMV